MDAGLGDSSWFRRRFGDAGPATARALIGAGLGAHNRSSDTKTASGLKTDEPYGATFWQVLAIGFLEHLSEVQGIGTAKPKGFRYEIPVINGTTVHALKCSSRSGSRSDRLKINWSQARDDSLAHVERLSDDVLPLEEWLADAGSGDFAEAPSSEDDAVVLAAFVASASGGLERIYIGDGYIDRNDNVHWVHVEEIPVRLEFVELDNTLTVPSDRFDSAPGDFDLDMGLAQEKEDSEDS